jgi:5-methylcytosine-specific restriction endonuclease McrA
MRHVLSRSRTSLALLMDFLSAAMPVGDNMTVNPAHCSLSVWTGLEGCCRWCDSELDFNQKRWCSGKCLQSWRLHHRYFLARQFTMKLARGKCLCIRSKNEERHVLCAQCGLCESQIRLRGEIMTCDHIVPRFGDRSKFSCNHHVNNLQILCSYCHDVKSDEDIIRYGL